MRREKPIRCDVSRVDEIKVFYCLKNRATMGKLDDNYYEIIDHLSREMIPLFNLKLFCSLIRPAGTCHCVGSISS